MTAERLPYPIETVSSIKCDAVAMRCAPDNESNPLGQLALHHGAVAVTVRLPSSGDDAQQVEWHVVGGENTWDVAWLLSLSREIGEPTGIHDAHRGRPKRGPSLEALDILVSIATWAATSAAWDATKAVGAALARHIAGGTKVPIVPLTDSEAVARARWLVADRYGEDAEALVVEAVDVMAGNTAEVTLAGAGWDYSCWLELHEELVTVSRVRRVRRR